MKATHFAILAVVAAGCGASNYNYTFDLTDPGARNLTRPGERDTLEDADIKAEILVDPTSFQAILLDITNKTDQLVMVNWGAITVIGPDGTETQIHPDGPAAPVDPGGRLVTRLVPFSLPSRGGAASQYDNSIFQLVVPMTVRGQPREYRYHLQAHLNSI